VYELYNLKKSSSAFYFLKFLDYIIRKIRISEELIFSPYNIGKFTGHASNKGYGEKSNSSILMCFLSILCVYSHTPASFTSLEWTISTLQELLLTIF